MSNTTHAAILLAATLLMSCQRADVRSLSDTTPMPVLRESPGALATRHEAQASLDRARMALERKDFAVSQSELADAAAFIRTEAEESEGEAKTSLRRAADQLDALANRVGKGEVHTAAELDRASLAVNRAEANFHLLRAKDAVANRDNVRAGEELTMSVDHLERAAKDAGRQTDDVFRSAVADARTLANEMMKGTGAVPDEMTKVTDELTSAISRLGRGVRVTKEP